MARMVPSRRPRPLLVVLWLVVLCLCAGGRPGRAQDDPDGWKRPTTPARIVGPIHYVGTYGLAVYLIATPDGHILIDGALPVSADRILTSIEALGFSPRDVKYLLTTQAHFDHVGSLAAVKAATGARVVVMHGDEGILSSGGRTDYLFANQPLFHFPAVTADDVVRDGHSVTVGDVTVTARHTPGHTPGTTTWTTTVRDGGQAYRVVFAGSTFVNPGTRLVRNPSYPGIEADYRRSFALLASLPVDIPLGAHTQAFDLHGRLARARTDGVAAFVDREALGKAAEASKAAFEKLVAAEK